MLSTPNHMHSRQAIEGVMQKAVAQYQQYAAALESHNAALEAKVGICFCCACGV